MWARVAGARGWRERVAGAARALRRVAGMPDYAAHLEHLRRCHPGRPVPTEREFFEQYVAARYGDGPTRCC
jgi:uncharacterized short protein YbdD (DUF466 family)